MKAPDTRIAHIRTVGGVDVAKCGERDYGTRFAPLPKFSTCPECMRRWADPVKQIRRQEAFKWLIRRSAT